MSTFICRDLASSSHLDSQWARTVVVYQIAFLCFVVTELTFYSEQQYASLKIFLSPYFLIARVAAFTCSGLVINRNLLEKLLFSFHF